MGRNRRTGIIPKCPICYTVYPIPGLNGRSGTVPKCPICVHCPSHPTVPWDEMDGLGYMPKCPICYTLSQLSIPSHCTMGQNGQNGIVPKCPTCYSLSPLSIPSHCEWTDEGCTKVSQLLCFVRTSNNSLVKFYSHTIVVCQCNFERHELLNQMK